MTAVVRWSADVLPGRAKAQALLLAAEGDELYEAHLALAHGQNASVRVQDRLRFARRANVCARVVAQSRPDAWNADVAGMPAEPAKLVQSMLIGPIDDDWAASLMGAWKAGVQTTPPGQPVAAYQVAVGQRLVLGIDRAYRVVDILRDIESGRIEFELETGGKDTRRWDEEVRVEVT